MVESQAIKFNSYTPEWSWLSNFSQHPVGVYPTAEHAYQASKSLDFEEQHSIRQAQTPKSAKAMSYAIQYPRSDWDQKKIWIMSAVLRKKFSNPELQQRLLSTGHKQLIHDAPWGDVFWGINRDGDGMNVQGQLLMALRDELRERSTRT